jgi:hypothetical protein
VFDSDDLALYRSHNRRAPSSNQGHTSDPSRFWEVVDAARVDQGLTPLFPSPMPTFRSGNVFDTAHAGPVIDPTAAVRGIVRLDPSAAQAQRQQEGARGRRHGGAESSEAAPTRRAASAPPRTLLSRSAMFNNTSHNIASLLQHQGAADTTDQSAVSRGTKSSSATSADSNSGASNSALQTAAKIARWAPGTLSNYYETRERLNIAGTAADGPGSPGRRMKSSLRRHHLAPASSGTIGGQTGAAGASVGGSSAVSVSSNAPFATGSTFA